MDKKDIIDFVGNKKYQWIATIAVLLVILFLSSSIRLSNWDLLTDSTTGEKIPLALDPYFFLRIAETIVENDGTLPEFDEMRVPGFETEWHPEIMPEIVVGMYRVANVFGDYSLRTVNVFSPVFFYFIGLIVFFFLCYFLTSSKIVGLISSGLLAFSPSYLYRTMAGFSDHESIGMVAVFACLLFYVFALNNFEKNWKRVVLYSLGSGFLTTLVLATWGGALTFMFMTIPISFGLYWLLKSERGVKALSFYAIWITSSVFFSWVIKPSLLDLMVAKLLATYGLIVSAVFGIMLIDYMFEFIIKSKKIKIKRELKTWYVLGTFVVLSSIALTFIGRNVFDVIKSVWHAVLFPFGTGRLGLTVAENAQPYLTDWINQSGSLIFWLFVFGIFMVGVGIGKFVKSKKHSTLFSLSWIVMISLMLFSRISSTSIFNGVNFISQVIYLVGVGVFVSYFVWLNMHSMFDKKSVRPLLILLMTLMFVVVLNGRSAIRTFFLIAPFVFLSVGYFLVEVFKYALKNKDDILKVILWGLFLFALVGILFSVNTYKENITNQAKYTGPSANAQWQGAMSWVRENTSKDAVFSHWWDYGYWVQTLGERATIADGGHIQSLAYDGDHKIGRYILTTPYPETALSMFKTLDVDYLLIDQTDLGKYPAYSKIGGGDGENELDRYSAIPVMPNDPKQTRETGNGTMIVFSGGNYIFEDIIYEDVFLPAMKVAIVGVIINIDGNSISRPEAVYIYNNVQTRIPIRYVYVNDEIIDFGEGLDAIIDIIPAFDGQQINPMGAAIYLSQKVSKSLFAQLFLMDDPFDNYESIELVHTEASPIVASLKSQGVPIGDFVYYRGFRGPIKIWDVQDIPEEIKVVPEIREPFNGTFGILDGMFGESGEGMIETLGEGLDV